ncbi:MAG: hypothetical protein R2697_15555 [Ilumatobacteraceae bacterium]
MASLIRKLVAASSPGTLMYIIVGLGVVSSIASDAGYLVLIPLGAGLPQRRPQPARRGWPLRSPASPADSA